MSVKEIERQVVKIIRNHLGDGAKVYLFGSWAKGDARTASDIDIAIEMNQKDKNERKKLSLIREEVDTLRTIRKIDIFYVSLTTKRFKDHIFKYAVSL